MLHQGCEETKEESIHLSGYNISELVIKVLETQRLNLETITSNLDRQEKRSNYSSRPQNNIQLSHANELMTDSVISMLICQVTLETTRPIPFSAMAEYWKSTQLITQITCLFKPDGLYSTILFYFS